MTKMDACFREHGSEQMNSTVCSREYKNSKQTHRTTANNCSLFIDATEQLFIDTTKKTNKAFTLQCI